MTRISLIILFVVGTAGCTQPIVRDQLSGKYILNSDVNDQIVLNLDSTYVHSVTLNNREFRSMGRWKFESQMSQVVFKDFVFFNGTGNDLPPGFWISTVKIIDGRHCLIYSDESEIYFTKTEGD